MRDFTIRGPLWSSSIFTYCQPWQNNNESYLHQKILGPLPKPLCYGDFFKGWHQWQPTLINITHYLILEGMDAIGQATLLADTMISSLVKPPDVIWLQVWCCRQPQLFDELIRDKVLLDAVINNEMQWGPLHPHLWMEEALPLFRISWFLWLNCCDHDSRSGVCDDDMSIFNIF